MNKSGVLAALPPTLKKKEKNRRNRKSIRWRKRRRKLKFDRNLRTPPSLLSSTASKIYYYWRYNWSICYTHYFQDWILCILILITLRSHTHNAASVEFYRLVKLFYVLLLVYSACSLPSTLRVYFALLCCNWGGRQHIEFHTILSAATQ